MLASDALICSPDGLPAGDRTTIMSDFQLMDSGKATTGSGHLFLPSFRMLAIAVSIFFASSQFTQAIAADTTTGVARLAVFDLEFQDASHEGAIDGERPDQIARLRLISDELRSLIRAVDRFELVDVEPARPVIANKGPLIYCNGCDRDIARDLGADLALTGLVYKVSNLILEIHLYVRDVESGNILAKMSSSIRGNTDESWLHGIRWMFKNRFMRTDLQTLRR